MVDALYGFLKGLGYGFPLHGPAVYLPAGLVCGAFVFFLIARLFGRPALLASARHASILALAFALPAILLGVFDWMHFHHGVLVAAIKAKIWLSASLLVLLGAGIIVGSEPKPRLAWMGAIYALSLAAVLALGYSGMTLVYGGREASEAGGRAIGMSEAPPKSLERGGPEEGEALFESNCAPCHPGGANAIVPSLPVRGSKRLASLEAFSAFLRAPAMPDGKPGQMPPFADDVLTDDQLESLFSYASAGLKP
jgi:mono/diheme cytochrome c family protein